ncbi:MAG: MFS transporter [Clostridiales bacterium]|nr:MFS transporter [Clostridiales bacterium]
MKKIIYGCGNLSYSVIGQTISNFFMFFATTVLGLSGTLVGVAIAISTVWDGISDTIIGYLSDNYPFLKMGKRNGYMLVATIGMSIFNIALWCVPSSLSDIVKFCWILVSLLLLETFNTMFATPYMALGNDIATSNNDRAKINASSTIFYLIGIIIPSILLYVFLPNTDLYPIGQLNPVGYVKIAFVTSLICLLCGLICSIFTKSKNIMKFTKERFSFKVLFANFISAFRHNTLRKIIFGYVFTCMATVFLCSVGLHFFTYSLFYTSNQITIALLSLIVGNILSQPLWVKIAKRKGSVSALVIAIIITVVSVFAVIIVFLFRIDLVNISFYIMIAILFICGVGSGGLYSLPSTIYGDAIMSICKNGDKNVATFSGALTFASNIANSITQLFVGVLLDIIKFDSQIQLQTLQVQTGLALILFIGVQVSLILACLIFSRVDKKKSKIQLT